jgi:hypothetical protein
MAILFGHLAQDTSRVGRLGRRRLSALPAERLRRTRRGCRRWGRRGPRRVG